MVTFGCMKIVQKLDLRRIFHKILVFQFPSTFLFQYGFFNHAFEMFITTKYGRDQWEIIR